MADIPPPRSSAGTWGESGNRVPIPNAVYRDNTDDPTVVDGFVVREASPEDVPAVLGLLGDLGRPQPAGRSEAAEFGRMVEGYIADGDKRILIATVGGRVVGMASVLLLPRLNHVTRELYVPELVVSHQYRRRGLGRALVGYCIKIAVENGCHRMRLESGNQRTDSHRFYRGLGFEQSALSFFKRTG